MSILSNEASCLHIPYSILHKLDYYIILELQEQQRVFVQTILLQYFIKAYIEGKGQDQMYFPSYQLSFPVLTHQTTKHLRDSNL